VAVVSVALRLAVREHDDRFRDACEKSRLLVLFVRPLGFVAVAVGGVQVCPLAAGFQLGGGLVVGGGVDVDVVECGGVGTGDLDGVGGGVADEVRVAWEDEQVHFAAVAGLDVAVIRTKRHLEGSLMLNLAPLLRRRHLAALLELVLVDEHLVNRPLLRRRLGWVERRGGNNQVLLWMLVGDISDPRVRRLLLWSKSLPTLHPVRSGVWLRDLGRRVLAPVSLHLFGSLVPLPVHLWHVVIGDFGFRSSLPSNVLCLLNRGVGINGLGIALLDEALAGRGLDAGRGAGVFVLATLRDLTGTLCRHINRSARVPQMSLGLVVPLVIKLIGIVGFNRPALLDEVLVGRGVHAGRGAGVLVLATLWDLLTGILGVKGTLLDGRRGIVVLLLQCRHIKRFAGMVKVSLGRVVRERDKFTRGRVKRTLLDKLLVRMRNIDTDQASDLHLLRQLARRLSGITQLALLDNLLTIGRRLAKRWVAEGPRTMDLIDVLWRPGLVLLDQHLVDRPLRVRRGCPVDLGGLGHLGLVLRQAAAPIRLGGLAHLTLLGPVLRLLRQVAESVVADHVEAPGTPARSGLVQGVEVRVLVLFLLVLRAHAAAVGDLGVVGIGVVGPGVVLLEHAAEFGAGGVLVHDVGGAVDVLDVDAVVGLFGVVAVGVDALAVGVRAGDLSVFALAGGVFLVVLELELVAVLGIGLLDVSVAEAVALLEVVRVKLGLAGGWSTVCVAGFCDVVAWDDAGRIMLAGSAVVVVTIGDACKSVSNSSFAVCLVSMTYHSPQRSWFRCDSGSYPQRRWSPHRRS
jgi:hypothetical protein